MLHVLEARTVANHHKDRAPHQGGACAGRACGSKVCSRGAHRTRRSHVGPDEGLGGPDEGLGGPDEGLGGLYGLRPKQDSNLHFRGQYGSPGILVVSTH